MDGSGNLLFGGFYTGSVTFGANVLTSLGQEDAFSVKMSQTGATLWAKSAGGTANDQTDGDGIDGSGNLYSVGLLGRQSTPMTFPTNPPTTLTPRGPYDVYVMKQSSVDGTAEWVTQLGGNNHDWSGKIATTAAGDSFVTGWTIGPNQQICGHTATDSYHDIFVARIHPTGRCLWAKTVGAPGVSDYPAGLAVSGTNVYVTGRFQGTASFGATQLTSLGGFDGVVFSMTDQGAFGWARGFHGTQDVLVGGVVVDGTNLYVYGTFSGTAQFGSYSLTATGGANAFVVRMTNTGTVSWAKNLGTSGILQMIRSASGKIYMTGSFSGTIRLDNITLTSVGGNDVLFAEIDSTGAFRRAERAGGPNNDAGRGIAVNSAGRIFIVGSYDRQGSFGPANLTASGNAIFLWAFQ